MKYTSTPDTSNQPLKKETKIVKHNSSHRENCSECKRIFEAMLRKTYGIVYRNHKLEAGVLPEDYVNSRFLQRDKSYLSDIKKFKGI